MEFAARSRKEVDKLLSELESSGLTIKAFAARKNIPVTTVYGWTRKRKAHATRRGVKATFLPVQIVENQTPQTSAPRMAPSLYLRLRSGDVLEIPQGTSPRWLCELLGGLQ